MGDNNTTKRVALKKSKNNIQTILSLTDENYPDKPSEAHSDDE